MADHLANHFSPRRNVSWIDDEDHPESHVERAVHLVVRDPASLADELEDRRHLPGLAVESRAKPVGQTTRKVDEKTPACGMRSTSPRGRASSGYARLRGTSSNTLRTNE